MKSIGSTLSILVGTFFDIPALLRWVIIGLFAWPTIIGFAMMFDKSRPDWHRGLGLPQHPSYQTVTR